MVKSLLKHIAKYLLTRAAKDLWTNSIKKATPEHVYQATNERTEKILEHLERIERRQEEDLRYLNDKIDLQISQVRNEIAALNERLDTIIQLINVNEHQAA